MVSEVKTQRNDGDVMSVSRISREHSAGAKTRLVVKAGSDGIKSAGNPAELCGASSIVGFGSYHYKL